MSKNELIAIFKLTKTGERVRVLDGRRDGGYRCAYIDPIGRTFIFYNNDLYAFKIVAGWAIPLAGYSWYH